VSVVYFGSMRSISEERSFLKKIRKIADILTDNIDEGDLVAIKLHFGELGNHGFLRPIFVRQVVDVIKEKGGKPFLTDSNTLYKGSRSNAVDHLNTAVYNGFSYASIGCPVIIADGIKGQYYQEIPVNLKYFRTVKIAGAIVDADYLLVLTHFKGHMMAGFGGAIKNVAMGCATRAGKQVQHADFKPPFNEEKCIGCGECASHCPEDAIKIVNGKSDIDYDRCTGCGECVTVCPTGAISIVWEEPTEKLEEKMAEYAFGVLKIKKPKVSFINFVVDVSPDCDCLPWHDANIIPDVGVFGSKDILSVEQASFDAIKNAPALPDTSVKEIPLIGEDKFYHIHHLSGETQLKYAEEIGLGERSYKIKRV